MARLVKESDGFAARVSKYVPSEVLALYITVENILRNLVSGGPPKENVVDIYLFNNGAGYLFILCIILIPVYLYYQSEKDADKYIRHALVSIVLFIVWLYALKGLMFDKNVMFLQGYSLEKWHSTTLSAIFMALVTAASGLVTNNSSPPLPEPEPAPPQP